MEWWTGTRHCADSRPPRVAEARTLRASGILQTKANATGSLNRHGLREKHMCDCLKLNLGSFCHLMMNVRISPVANREQLRRDCSHGDLWVKMFGSRFHGKSPVVARYPRSEPVCMTRPVSDAASNSHPVAALSAAPISRLRRARTQEGGTILFFGFFKPSKVSVRSPGSAGADRAPED